jgi:transposase
MKAYSTDLRERVVRAADEGHTRDEISEMLGVSRATIKRYLQQRRETGNLDPKPIPGRPATKGGALQADIVRQLEAHRDATIQEHCRIWEAEHGQQVSTATMSRAISRVGWTRKKRHWAPPSAMKRLAMRGESR